MTRLAPLARRFGLDALILAGALASALEVAVRHDPETEPTMARWLAAPLIALLLLPLLARRRLPFAAPAGLWLLGVAVSFADGRLIVFSAVPFMGGMAASFLLGNHRRDALARAGLAITLGGAAVVVANNPRHTTGDLVFTPVLFAIGWLAGFALRERAERAEAAELRATQAERERETAARIAVAEERARITRELHDIVAHAVSVMVLQVGAVRHRLPETMDEDSAALRGVEQTGRGALTEMRRLLGALHTGIGEAARAPQPGIDRLEALAREIEHAGLPVHLRVEGEPVELPAGLDLSAYRIVQEGLTNALKHARATRADVVVRFAAGELQIDVRDDGGGAAVSDGLGHGLIGMRERVKIYGGEMSAGNASGGGFLLSTRLPLAEPVP